MKMRIHGQAASEYLVLVSLLALALVVGPDSALEQPFRAVDQRMGAFTFAISLP